MMILRLDLKVQCSQCGVEMPHCLTQSGPVMWVAPCLKCLRKANDAGFEEGHERGWNEAKQEKQGVLQ